MAGHNWINYFERANLRLSSCCHAAVEKSTGSNALGGGVDGSRGKGRGKPPPGRWCLVCCEWSAEPFPGSRHISDLKLWLIVRECNVLGIGCVWVLIPPRLVQVQLSSSSSSSTKRNHSCGTCPPPCPRLAHCATQPRFSVSLRKPESSIQKHVALDWPLFFSSPWYRPANIC